MEPKTTPLNILVDLAQTILIAAAIFIVIYQFLFRPFQIDGSSMYPNFVNKEFVLTNVITYRFEKPARGDIVVFKAPLDKEKAYIKRIIGIPGDNVSLNNNHFWVNNRPIDESAYLQPEVVTSGGTFLREGQSTVVPQDNYFVAGDNRSGSADSRAWGFVDKSLIEGKSMFVYWPIENARSVKNVQLLIQ